MTSKTITPITEEKDLEGKIGLRVATDILPCALYAGPTKSGTRWYHAFLEERDVCKISMVYIPAGEIVVDQNGKINGKDPRNIGLNYVDQENNPLVYNLLARVLGANHGI